MTFNYYIEKYDIIFIKMIIYLSNSFIPFPFPLLLLCTSMCINFDKTFSIHPTLYISHIFYHFQYSIYTCSSIFFCVELFSFIWRLAFNISCSQSHCWWVLQALACLKVTLFQLHYGMQYSILASSAGSTIKMQVHCFWFHHFFLLRSQLPSFLDKAVFFPLAIFKILLSIFNAFIRKFTCTLKKNLSCLD